MFVCYECCVLSGRGICDNLITRPEESYRLWCVVVCDLVNLMNYEVLAHWGLTRQTKERRKSIIVETVFKTRHEGPEHLPSNPNRENLFFFSLSSPVQTPPLCGNCINGLQIMHQRVTLAFSHSYLEN
jgi:hypothetical protein